MSVIHLIVGRLDVTRELNRADCARTKNANRVISCAVITVFLVLHEHKYRGEDAFCSGETWRVNL